MGLPVEVNSGIWATKFTAIAVCARVILVLFCSSSPLLLLNDIIFSKPSNSLFLHSSVETSAKLQHSTTQSCYFAATCLDAMVPFDYDHKRTIEPFEPFVVVHGIAPNSFEWLRERVLYLKRYQWKLARQDNEYFHV